MGTDKYTAHALPRRHPLSQVERAGGKGQATVILYKTNLLGSQRFSEMTSMIYQPEEPQPERREMGLVRSSG